MPAFRPPAFRRKTITMQRLTTWRRANEQAVEEYRAALAADSGFVDALHGLSRALQNLNRLDEAIEAANQISALDPEDVLAHTSLSILYQKKGMIPEAEAEANKARVLGWKQQLKGK